MKRSCDGGRTWSGRLPAPASWESSRETPTIQRTAGADGRRRPVSVRFRVEELDELAGG